MSDRPPRELPGSLFTESGRPERALPPGLESRSTSDYSKEKEDGLDSPSLPILTHHNVSFREEPHPNRGEGPSNDLVKRKRSLVRPERQPVDPNSALYNYRFHAAAFNADQGRIGLSKTGNYPLAGTGLEPSEPAAAPQLRRGVSILAREDPGQSILKRGATIRKTKGKVGRTEELNDPVTRKGPLSPWMIYAQAVTCCFPPALLRCFGEFA
jgi:chitin synthase